MPTTLGPNRSYFGGRRIQTTAQNRPCYLVSEQSDDELKLRGSRKSKFAITLILNLESTHLKRLQLIQNSPARAVKASSYHANLQITSLAKNPRANPIVFINLQFHLEPPTFSSTHVYIHMSLKMGLF